MYKIKTQRDIFFVVYKVLVIIFSTSVLSTPSAFATNGITSCFGYYAGSETKNENISDNDDDGRFDSKDPDDDDDKICDRQEIIDGTDPYDKNSNRCVSTTKTDWGSNSSNDNDLDGIPDDKDSDDDNDGVSDHQEKKDGTDPKDPCSYRVKLKARKDKVATNKNTPVTINVLENDSYNDPIQLTASVEQGSVVVNSDFTLTYTPPKDYVGKIKIKYTIEEIRNKLQIKTGSHSNKDSSKVKVYVVDHVNPDENRPPVAVDDLLDTDTTTPQNIDVLANDSDPDGDTLTILSVEASMGDVSINGDKVLYIAPDNFEGTVFINYKITDNRNAFAFAKVVVNIDTVEEPDPCPCINVTPPANKTVDATGIFTKVDVGTATAVDDQGNPIPVILLTPNTWFKPGVNLIYWKASNELGKTKIVSQEIHVNPLVSLSRDRTVRESESISVRVLLNGTSPVYPLEIPYTVTDIENNTVITNDNAIINEGTELSLSIAAGRSVKVQLDQSVNQSFFSQNETKVTMEAIKPRIQFDAVQNAQPRRVFTKDGGGVIVRPNVYTPNVNPNLSYLWSGDTSLLNVQEVTSDTLQFDPKDINSGVYKIHLVAKDVDNDLEIENLFTIRIIDAIPNNVLDLSDADADGIIDSQETLLTCNTLPEQLRDIDSYVIEGEPGTCLQLGLYALDRVAIDDSKESASGTQIDEFNHQAGSLDIPQDELFYHFGGRFNYSASNLANPMDSHFIVLPQRYPLHKESVLRLFDFDKTWVNFAENEKNIISSASGYPGYCPPPGSEQWQAGLRAGYWCVQVQIEDGGENDFDGKGNGAISFFGSAALPKGVIENNESPVANNDSVTVKVNESVTIDVLENDSDPDGDALTIASIESQLGSAEVVDNKIQYQAPESFVGEDVVIYVASDGKGGIDVARVTVTINSAGSIGTLVSVETKGGGFIDGWFLLAVVLFLMIKTVRGVNRGRLS